MKAFNKVNIMAYVATLSDAKDESYESPKDMAAEFIAGFETWLAIKDLPKIKLPVTVRGPKVVAADGNLIATCSNWSMARAMAVQLNAGCVRSSSVEHTDKEAEIRAGNISASGKRVRREVRVKNDEDESWDETPEKAKTKTKTAGVKKAKKVTK